MLRAKRLKFRVPFEVKAEVFTSHTQILKRAAIAYKRKSSLYSDFYMHSPLIRSNLARRYLEDDAPCKKLIYPFGLLSQK